MKPSPHKRVKGSKKNQILKLYYDISLWRPPSYGFIAKRVKCVKSYVFKIINPSLPTPKRSKPRRK